MKKYISLLMLILCAIAHAQDTSKVAYNATLDVGPQSVVLKDLYRSPYVYRGLYTFIGIGFARFSSTTIHALEAGYTFGAVKSSFSPQAKANALFLDYQCFGRLICTPKHGLAIGPQLLAQAWRVNYFPKMEAPIYAQVHTYMVALSLGMSIAYRHKISERSALSLRASLPILNYIERPRFMDGEVPQSLGIFNFWNPTCKLNYTYNFSNRFCISMSYKYAYLQYAQPKTVRMLQNGISIGFEFKIR